MGSYLVPGGRMCFDIGETFMWGYSLTTTFIPCEHSHHSCLCCGLDIGYSVLEVLERRVGSHFSPRKFWLSHQNWHKLLFSLVGELSRLWQQHSKGGDWWEQDSGTSGCKKWHHEEKSHHEGRCWHLASVLLLLNQESVCALTAAWHNVSSAEARLLNSVPGLQRTPGCHNLLAAM